MRNVLKFGKRNKIGNVENVKVMFCLFQIIFIRNKNK